MKVYLGADHRGFELKNKIKKWIEDLNIEQEDFGAFEYDPEDDYPLIAEEVAQKISSEAEVGKTDVRGIVICGSGVGVDVTMNKFKHIRSGLAVNWDQVKKAREDDDINVLSLPSEYLSEGQAKRIVEVFLLTEFSEEERKKRRLEEIERIENEQGS